MAIRGWFVILTGFTMDLRCHSLKNTPPSATNELRDQKRRDVFKVLMTYCTVTTNENMNSAGLKKQNKKQLGNIIRT